uniref:Ig-like domain-containing protein n=1 Tax=Amphilophus citrinellus TaxID=61819 RepID=A0A3Q0TA74_AMPCI
MIGAAGMNNRTLICLTSPCSTLSSLLEINVTAESGQNVTLTCRTPNKNIVVVEWSRADLESDYVLLYRDEQLVPEHQHPSFKNRVDLQDRQMKDGDVSVILRNVTINDTGTYECRIIQRRTNRWNRALLKTAPISTITLRVVAPPGENTCSILADSSCSFRATSGYFPQATDLWSHVQGPIGSKHFHYCGNRLILLLIYLYKLCFVVVLMSLLASKLFVIFEF